MDTRETQTITIRKTVTYTIKMTQSKETEKSTVTPLLVIVLGAKA